MKRASYLISGNGDGDCEVEEKEPKRITGKRYRFRSCSRTNSSSSTAMVVPPPPPPPPPDVIINEILTRVSLEPLICRCRLVCKDWRRLTYDSDFKLMHSQRTPTISGYLLQMVGHQGQMSFKFVSFINNNQDDHSETVPTSIPPSPPNYLDFLPINPGKYLDILSSSSPHGLFLCQDLTSYYVCKPATREWQKIPPPRYHLRSKIAIVVVRQKEPQQRQQRLWQQQQQLVNPLHYKIIQLGTTMSTELGGKYTHYLECEIFDSKNWDWKTYSDKTSELPNCFAKMNQMDDPGVIVHGAVHWLSHCEYEICALDINKLGPWKVIPPPSDEQLLNEMHDYYASRNEIDHYPYAHQIQLVEYEGELGLMYLGFRKRLTLELWVLKDYNYYGPQLNRTVIWDKIYSIDLGPGYGEIRLRDLKCRVLQLYTKDIILMQIEDEVIWYNCKTGTRNVAVNIPAGYWIPNVHPIHSDLLPCNWIPNDHPTHFDFHYYSNLLPSNI